MRRVIVPMVLLLLVLSLACNAPGFGPEPVSTPLPAEVATAIPETEPPPEIAPTETPLPRTRIVPPERTPPAKATHTAVPTGAPLTFGEPAWELVEWHEVPDTGDWEGTIKVNVVGGTPPYRYQLEDHPIREEPELTARWRLCKAMPATIRVWSADGQHVSTPIWVWELGCQP